MRYFDRLPLPVFESLLHFSQVMHNKCSFMNEAHVVYSTPTTFYIIHLAVGCVTWLYEIKAIPEM